ncbi:MAG: hypothetical protein R3229_09885 [Alphaproteobacteria bacterium]|nr:hypothetical protein [Alphaproteobacteria bacterium]
MPASVALVQPDRPTADRAPTPLNPETARGEGFAPFGRDGLTFDDILDIVNPLHHLPVVGALYRAVTGDTISPAAKIAGGAVFGGALGFAASLADTVLEEASGKDAAGHVLAALNEVGAPATDGADDGGAGHSPSWRETASLRHDRHEHDDLEDPTGAHGTSVAAATGGDRGSGQLDETAVVLRYWAKDIDEPWEAPAYMQDGSNLAEANGQPDPMATVSSVAAKSGEPAPAAAALTMSATKGPAGRGTTLPPPRALAANPAMVTAFQRGQSPDFRPGGTIDSEAWISLMNAAGGRHSGTASPTGSRGLAAATVAKALATYGEAMSQPSGTAKGGDPR